MNFPDWNIWLFRIYAVINAVFLFVAGGIVIRLLYRITRALETLAARSHEKNPPGRDG